MMESNDVRILGIWGMEIVGKMIIVRANFDMLSPQFDGACFLAHIKKIKKCNLCKISFSLNCQGKKQEYTNNMEDRKHLMARRLHFKKVLVVLDDINHGDHLNDLTWVLDWFSKGSRIIATKRDKHLIEKNVVYEVTLPIDHQLFNQQAFKEEVPDNSFEKLTLEVVGHANGLPLALNAWGSFLHNRGITAWRSATEQMKMNSKPEIVEKLKISYDVFLDLAFFI
nr:TMV resistance protein N-like [Solanum lycopersicum]